MNALEEFRAMIEEHWPHSDPYWREGDMQFAPAIDAIADRIEAEYVELPKGADGVPCKIGDYVRSGETCGNIKEMLWYKRGWELYLTTLDDSVSADAVRHVKPDSYETLHSDLKSCTNKATADDFITRAKALAGVEQ